ncbi:MAG: AAA family ATPase, partial [Bacteroidales bacterium]|nr:AAA family ATPase [Bacteroidales bacterium]NMB71020.1 AAA family ATPase [Bacteroidales bacterium]
GVRRCGKSTLLKQIAEKTDEKYLYFNSVLPILFLIM